MLDGGNLAVYVSTLLLVLPSPSRGVDAACVSHRQHLTVRCKGLNATALPIALNSSLPSPQQPWSVPCAEFFTVRNCFRSNKVRFFISYVELSYGEKS